MKTMYDPFTQDEYAKAEETFRESLALDASDPETNIMLGACLARQGKFDEAISYLTLGIELSTDEEERASVYAYLGDLYFAREEWKDAIENYETAIRLSDVEKTTGNLFNLGLAYVNVEEYAKSEAAFREYLTLDPSNVDANINLGTSLIRQGKADEAIRCYKKGMKLSTNDRECSFAYANIGDAYFYLKDWKKSIKYYETAIRLSDEQKTAMNYFTIGFAYGALRENTKAEAAFRESLALDPSDSETNNNLGNSLARQGKFDEAIHFYEIGIELSTDDEERSIAYVNLGRMYEVREEWEKVIEHFENAIRLNELQKTVQNFFSIGIAYGKLKEDGKAAAAFRECLARDPTNIEAHINLGASLANEGKFDEAMPYFKRGIEFGNKEERSFASRNLEKLYAKRKKGRKNDEAG